MRLRRLALQFSSAFLLTLVVLGQQTQQPPTPPPTPPTTPPPNQPPSKPPVTTSPPQSAPQTRLPDELRRPIYLSGCVQMEDGSVPPQEVRVRLYCPGNASSGELRLDPRGCFRVQISSGYEARSGPRFQVAGCEIRAELPGYGMGTLLVKKDAPFGDNDVGTLVINPLTPGEVGSVSLNTLSAPEDARRAYDKARAELGKEKPNRDRAAKELQKAVSKYTQFASAWQLLGEIYDTRQDEVLARDSFEKAIAADPKYLTPYLSLGNIELRNQHWSELNKLSDKVLSLKADSIEGQYFKAVSNYRLGQLEQAEKAARFVLEHNAAGQYPPVHLILGDILSQRGDVPAAAAQFRSFLVLRPDGQNSQTVRSRLQSWEQQGLIR